MDLWIMRHGAAVSRDDPNGPPDPQRPLTEEGMDKTRAAAQGLVALGLRPERILSSPYVRARQTAELASQVLGAGLAAVESTDALLGGSAPRELFEVLAEQDAQAVLCCGHAPHLDQVIAYALRAADTVTRLKKAGAAHLALDGLGPPLGVLAGLYPPRVLRTLGQGKG